MSKDFNFKCSHCGLCQDDDDNREYTCGDDKETQLSLFEDDEPELITTDKGFVFRFLASCATGTGMTFIDVDVDNFYHLDTIYSALSAYCRQEDGLDRDLLHVGSIKDGNHKWKDIFIYDERIIGYWLGECVANLDKAKAGESYGRPFHESED